MLRVIGSPDPYAAQIDGMGGATSSTSKTVILAKAVPRITMSITCSAGVSIDKAFVDWSGNCGNLSTAVAGVCGSAGGLVRFRPRAENGTGHRAHLAGQHRQDHHRPRAGDQRPVQGNRAISELDGVTFPAAEGACWNFDPSDDEGDGGGSMFPPAIWSMTSKCPASAR